MNFRLNVFEIIILIINVMLLILYILNSIKLTKLRKNYSEFMTKLGKGENINEMLKIYVDEVENVKKENAEIEEYCRKLEEKSKDNLKKVGIVRYNAYKNTVSELSFALALLNERDTGFIINGIYGQDNSNVYAKPIVNGNSKYALSIEESEALKEAMNKKL